MPEPVVVYDGLLSMHYGFAYLHTERDGDYFADLDVARAGHRNGLCTAGVPHQLSMMTATHTGSVRFRIEWTYAPPPLGDEWEDVVEASVDIATTEGVLAAFEEFHDLRFPLTGPHRARYCAIDMALAEQGLDEEPGDGIPIEPDRYLLQLWPVAMAPDAIVREHSDQARYWHSVARSTPALTPQQLDEYLAQRAGSDDGDFDVEGGDFVEAYPSPASLALSGQLVMRLLTLDRPARRDVARWCAQRAVTYAGIADDERVAAALAALAAGRPLPPPFDDLAAALAAQWRPERADESDGFDGEIVFGDDEADDEPDDTADSDLDLAPHDRAADDGEGDASFRWYADDAEFEQAADAPWSTFRIMSREPSGPDLDRALVLLAVSAVDAAADADPTRAAVNAYRHLAAFAPAVGPHIDRELEAWLDGT